MHTLYTTGAFVLGHMPHGESNRTYRLLTETHGLIYAHAQSVRELRNRNRYALKTARMIQVTLVRGREVWRITSACPGELSTPPHPSYRRLLGLIGTLTPVEEPCPGVYRVMWEYVNALTQHRESLHDTIELVGLVRLLTERGYLAVFGAQAPFVRTVCESEDAYTDAFLATVTAHRSMLLRVVNNALRASRA